VVSILATQTIKEYVALAPTSGIDDWGGRRIQWNSVEYTVDVARAQDVTLGVVSEAVPELGAWLGLDPWVNSSGLGSLADTGRVFGDTLYTLHSHDLVAFGGGCCADELRIYKRDGGGTFATIPLIPFAQQAVGDPSAKVSHTFELAPLPDGTMTAFFVLTHAAWTIGKWVSAIARMNLTDGSLMKTVNGTTAFLLDKDSGFRDFQHWSETRFKIQHYRDHTGPPVSDEHVFGEHLDESDDQYHGNGLCRFRTSDGVQLLGFSAKFDYEVVLFKDPYTYSGDEGGGQIVQRFGMPRFITSSGDLVPRYFGLKSNESIWTDGVHNIFHTAESPTFGGKESITMFVNSQGEKSVVYEFEVNPVEENSAFDTGDDSLFDVRYVSAPTSFHTMIGGGARVIGNGVYLVSSGSGNVDRLEGDPGLEVVDVAGSIKNQSYILGHAKGFYDPYIRVAASSTSSAIFLESEHVAMQDACDRRLMSGEFVGTGRLAVCTLFS
jgi:hypothetical protein